MLTPDDYAQMRDDLAEMIGDNRVEVTLRRGSQTLAAQGARIVRSGPRAQQARANASSAARAMVIVYGTPEMDIRRGDRFTLEGTLFEVGFVRPSRLVGTVAEAEAVE
ncbi:hypothetical protein SY88_23710 [Clostridiales bacterium PH28_bin88]|nr:hypothetical protein SY88_23710 [Clostridiales bacterium PH28_bin88]